MQKEKKIPNSIYPISDLTEIGMKIYLEDEDNVNSVRVIVSQFKKNNAALGWGIKVVKDHVANKMMILRVK